MKKDNDIEMRLREAVERCTKEHERASKRCDELCRSKVELAQKIEVHNKQLLTMPISEIPSWSAELAYMRDTMASYDTLLPLLREFETRAEYTHKQSELTLRKFLSTQV